MENLRKREKVFAGTGATLEEAAAPAYLDTNGVRVALLGACATEDPACIAGNRNTVILGRPGLNPLRFETTYFVQKPYFDMLS